MCTEYKERPIYIAICPDNKKRVSIICGNEGKWTQGVFNKKEIRLVIEALQECERKMEE